MYRSVEGPSAIGNDPVERRGFHQQPDDVDGAPAIDPSAQRDAGGQPVDDPGGGDRPLGLELVGDRSETFVAASGFEGSQDKGIGTLGGGDQDLGDDAKELLGGSGCVRPGGPETFENRDRLVVTGDGDVG